MKTFLILRHAKSSWKNPGMPDHERPLNGRGKNDAPNAGRWLREQGLLPEVILCSTAKRARQTAKAVVEESGFSGELRLLDELYAAEAEAYLEAVRNLSASVESVMVVGHNPGLEELVEILTGESVRMPTAALAHVLLEIDSWQDLPGEEQGKLVELWTPRRL